jgi:hypothetical protein
MAEEILPLLFLHVEYGGGFDRGMQNLPSGLQAKDFRRQRMFAWLNELVGGT